MAFSTYPVCFFPTSESQLFGIQFASIVFFPIPFRHKASIIKNICLICHIMFHDDHPILSLSYLRIELEFF